MGLSLPAFLALDEDDQETHVAIWHRERERCSQCGMPRSVCRDAERDWYPQRVVCHATQARMAARRRWEAAHEKAPFHNGTFESWAEKAGPAHPFHRDDGVTIEVTTEAADADDDWLAQTS